MKQRGFKYFFVAVALLISFSYSAFIFSSTKTSTQQVETQQHHSPLHKLLKFLWGKPDGTNLYLGMWTYHFRHQARHDDNWQNWLVAVAYKGFYAGTFKNSYYDWTISAGVQRIILAHYFPNGLALKLGYRAGGIYGYDHRLCGKFCEDVKVLPFILPYADIQYKRVGVEFMVFNRFVTAAFYIHLPV